ncbi:MAG: recombinase RecT [Thermus sp.]|uniref:recombinase RecT n=1 Tax=Thermus sp. TaxID=275 RepID=UPI003D148A91
MPKDELALDPREVAVLARERLFAGVPDEDVKLALAICQRYGLDPLLRHVVLIPGGKNGRHAVYITRDGLLHVAHASGKAWSLEVGEPERRQNPYTGKEDIYLKGRLRVVDERGREQVFEGGVWFSEYAGKGGAWATYPAAMHQKALEASLLRRAFDVALPPLEEAGEAPPPAPLSPERARALSAAFHALGLKGELAREVACRAVEREVATLKDLTPLEAEELQAYLGALEEASGRGGLPKERVKERLEGWLARHGRGLPQPHELFQEPASEEEA